MFVHHRLLYIVRLVKPEKLQSMPQRVVACVAELGYDPDLALFPHHAHHGPCHLLAQDHQVRHVLLFRPHCLELAPAQRNAVLVQLVVVEAAALPAELRQLLMRLPAKKIPPLEEEAPHQLPVASSAFAA